MYLHISVLLLLGSVQILMSVVVPLLHFKTLIASYADCFPNKPCGSAHCTFIPGLTDGVMLYHRSHTDWILRCANCFNYSDHLSPDYTPMSFHTIVMASIDVVYISKK